ncbi:hypothetical protein FRB95_007921 [Tulasnella sp. JGI-2019a]|nr:hypothetical protein FRB95_007921 [Tulasnella sp. JGI-2019a]
MVYGRNVTVFDPSKLPPKVVAGFYQHGNVSIATFYSWLRIILVTEEIWHLFYSDRKAHQVTQPNPLDFKSTEPLNAGHYIILSVGLQPIRITLTTERYRPRTVSTDVTGTKRSNTFRERVRARDQRCCVSGDPVYESDYGNFIACHIFPKAHQNVWSLLSMSKYIADDVSENDQGLDCINSLQNGLLMVASFHAAFDSYQFGINPDGNYGITGLAFRGGRLDGRHLYIDQNVDKKYRPWPAYSENIFDNAFLRTLRVMVDPQKTSLM